MYYQQNGANQNGYYQQGGANVNGGYYQQNGFSKPVPAVEYPHSGQTPSFKNIPQLGQILLFPWFSIFFSFSHQFFLFFPLPKVISLKYSNTHCLSSVNAATTADSLKAGYVTYSNKAKRKVLGVKQSTLKKYTAVSAKVAEEMAQGVSLLTKADVTLSVTGVAGPDGGTEEKPVGLIYIGCSVKGRLHGGNCQLVCQKQIHTCLF